MNCRIPVPPDFPAAACGRFIWFDTTNVLGDGRCILYREYRFYKCMVCCEYEQDNDVNIAPAP